VALRRRLRGSSPVHRERELPDLALRGARVGHAAIQAFWPDDEGKTFSVSAEPVAVEGPDAVIRLEMRYRAPVAQEYRDLWVLRFASDGRVEDLEEWAYWPRKPYSADTDATE
jgi:hypothetical protein